MRETADRPPREDPRLPVLAALLPLRDTFTAARSQTIGDQRAWQETVTALEGRLEQTLLSLGLEPQAKAGIPFDPLRHVAVFGAHSPQPEGTVLAVLRQGYMLEGRVFRLAEVQVSLGPQVPGTDDAPAAPNQEMEVRDDADHRD